MPGVPIFESGYAADDGSVPPAVASALAAYEAGAATYAETLDVLQRSRLLVPVVAVAGQPTSEQPTSAQPTTEQPTTEGATTEMATVLLTGKDGRTALLAFTGTEPLRAWDAQARPVPVAAAVAARSAVQEGADAVVVDVAGPTRFVIEGEDLAAVAAGWTLARVGERTAWIRPAEE